VSPGPCVHHLLQLDPGGLCPVAVRKEEGSMKWEGEGRRIRGKGGNDE